MSDVQYQGPAPPSVTAGTTTGFGFQPANPNDYNYPPAVAPQSYIYPSPRQPSDWGHDDFFLDSMKRNPGVMPGPFAPQMNELNQVFAHSLGFLGQFGSPGIAGGSINAMRLAADYQQGLAKGQIARAELTGRQLANQLNQLRLQQSQELQKYFDITAAYKGNDLKTQLTMAARTMPGGPDTAMLAAIANGKVDALLATRDIHWITISKGAYQAAKDAEQQGASAPFNAPTPQEQQQQQEPPQQGAQQPAVPPASAFERQPSSPAQTAGTQTTAPPQTPQTPQDLYGQGVRAMEQGRGQPLTQQPIRVPAAPTAPPGGRAGLGEMAGPMQLAQAFGIGSGQSNAPAPPPPAPQPWETLPPVVPGSTHIGPTPSSARPTIQQQPFVYQPPRGVELDRARAAGLDPQLIDTMAHDMLNDPTMSLTNIGSSPRAEFIKNLIVTRSAELEHDLETIINDPRIQGRDAVIAAAKAVDPEWGNNLELYIDGRAAPPSNWNASKEPFRQQLSMGNKADPTFNNATFQVRMRNLEAFTSGRDGTNLLAIATAFSHGKELLRNLEALRRLRPGLVPDSMFFNTPLNSLLQTFGTDSSAYLNALSRYNSTLDAFAPEVDSAWTGKAATVTGIRDYKSELGANRSIGWLENHINQKLDLLKQKLLQEGDKFAIGTGWTQQQMYEKFDQYVDRNPAKFDFNGSQYAAEDVQSAPQLMRELLRRFNNAEFDLVAVGRGHIGDPDWVKKIAQRNYSDIRLFTKQDLLGDLEIEGSFVEEAHRGDH